MAPDVTTQDDAALVARMAARDAEAVSILYDRYRSAIYTLALRILRNPAEAEEILTDIFMQAWRSAATFDASRGSVAAWLITLARSRALDRLRSSGRREAHHQPMPEVEVAPPPRRQELEGPERDADIGLKRRRIGAALNALSAPQRAAIELAYYEGMTQSEIARRLGEPLGTVKTRIRQSLMLLRDNLAEQFQ